MKTKIIDCEDKQDFVFMMERFNEIESNMKNDLVLVQKDLKLRELEVQQQRESLKKKESQFKMKEANLTERNLAAVKKLAILQSAITENKSRNEKRFNYLEERLEELERELARSRRERSNQKQGKRPLTGLDSVGEDGEY